jgi:hypothetical protein
VKTLIFAVAVGVAAFLGLHLLAPAPSWEEMGHDLGQTLDHAGRFVIGKGDTKVGPIVPPGGRGDEHWQLPASAHLPRLRRAYLGLPARGHPPDDRSEPLVRGRRLVVGSRETRVGGAVVPVAGSCR